MKINDIIILLNYYINVPAKILFRKYNDVIIQDIRRYVCQIPEYEKKSDEILFFALLVKRPAYRSVLYYRIKNKNICYLIVNMLFPPLKTIEITGQFGMGMFIAHNYCVISVKKAGCNLSIMGGVTIGEKNGKVPCIGNNVYIGANSCIVGGIIIGNNVKIGAGSVVITDIPDNAVVAGNPAVVKYFHNI